MKKPVILTFLLLSLTLFFACKKEKKGGGTKPDEPSAEVVKVPVRQVDKWTVVNSRLIHSGLRLTEYSCDTCFQRIWVATINLNEPRLEIGAGISDEIIPNPGGGSHPATNNGPNRRETCSDFCARRRASGEKVLVGINADYFNTENGVLWGQHIEDGIPCFVGNPDARVASDSKRRGFTYFADRTVECGGLRDFSGSLEIDGKKYEYCSINDTTLRNLQPAWPVNLYNSRYVRVPHAEEPGLVNPLYAKALYVRFRFDDAPMKVNGGWADATVTGIYDGRASFSPDPPYLTDPQEWAMQVTGATATEFASRLVVGKAFRLRADMTIEGKTVPAIQTQVSGAQHYINKGVFSTTWSDSRSPMTWTACDATGKIVWFFVADGRQSKWSVGVNRYELSRFGQQIGAWDLNVMDGGGSTAMWVFQDGKGALVNRPSDSKGERSDLNYLYVRLKD